MHTSIMSKGFWLTTGFSLLLSGTAMAQTEVPDPDFDGGTGVATYDTGANERANAVTTDSSGNIYVVGTSDAGGMLTMKYNPTGTLLWAETFVESSTSDEASTVVVDNATGDVYVAGGVTDGTNRFVVIKYDSSGNQYGIDATPDSPVETTSFGGSEWGSDSDGNGTTDTATYYWNAGYPTAMVRDTSGNLIISGWEDDGGGSIAVMTIKMDSHGHIFGSDDDADVAATAFGNYDWGGESNSGNDVAYFDYSGTDYAHAMALDEANSVFYVAGDDESGTAIPFVLKYDLDGQRYGNAGGAQAATAYGNTDNDGNLVNDIFYNNSASPGIAYGIAVDSTGNAYVCGYVSIVFQRYWLVFQLNGTGTLVEPFGNADLNANTTNDSITYNSGNFSDEVARAIAVDSAGGFFAVAGTYYSLIATDIRTAKYSASTGSELWSAVFTSAGPTREPRGIALGSIIVAGYSNNTSDDDVRLLKYTVSAAGSTTPARHRSNSRCYVAAASGATRETLTTLTAWRDRVLVTHPVGKTFVALYDTFGPVAAGQVKASPALKGLARTAIVTPLEGIARLSDSVWGMLILLAALVAVPLLIRRRLSAGRTG